MSTSTSSGGVCTFILCGGGGTRLWPLSTEKQPKQFQTLVGEKTLLAQTIQRAKLVTKPEDIFLIGSAQHTNELYQHCLQGEINPSNCFVEPSCRSTAAAVASASCIAREAGHERVILMPCDHLIENSTGFQSDIAGALGVVNETAIIVFGIPPTRPDSDLGYIGTLTEKSQSPYVVENFIEKPELDNAIGFLEDDRYFWNSGIYIFSVTSMNTEFVRLAPDILLGAKNAVYNTQTMSSGLRQFGSEYSTIRSESFDKVITENVADLRMLDANFDWHDLGNWNAVLAASNADENGNYISGNGLILDSQHCLVFAQDSLAVLHGVRDLAVISNDGSVLVYNLKNHPNPKVFKRFADTGKSTDVTPISMRKKTENWFLDEILPNWQSKVVDWENGGFHDALNFDFTPSSEPKRLRTMGRLTHAFALATSKGMLTNGFETVAHGIEYFSSILKSMGGLFECNNTKSSKPADLMDLSCILLGASSATSLGIKGADALAAEIFDLSANELINNKATFTSKAAANTLMHLHEAFLSWYEVSNEKRALQFSNQIMNLFDGYLLDKSAWVVGEAGFSETNKTFWIPGHSYEWSWRCIRHYKACSQTGVKDDVKDLCHRLDMIAASTGTNPETDLPWLKMKMDGRQTQSCSRSWALLEGIRSAVGLRDLGVSGYESELDFRIELFFNTHLKNAPAGGWIDMVDEGGDPISNNMPSSILYHLVNAFSLYLERENQSQLKLRLAKIH